MWIAAESKNRRPIQAIRANKRTAGVLRTLARGTVQYLVRASSTEHAILHSCGLSATVWYRLALMFLQREETHG
jgi:hypothetical protein